jgi:hypothetical protein
MALVDGSGLVPDPSLLKAVPVVITFKGVYIKGELRKQGELVMVPENAARDLIGMKRARRATEADVASSAEPEGVGEPSGESGEEDITQAPVVRRGRGARK